MDKITKFLKRLNKAELIKIKKILQDIQIMKLQNHDVKALKGELKGLYRLRSGKIRVVFLIENNIRGDIISIDFRKGIYK